MDAVLIFPHQLFKNHPALAKNRRVFVIEHPRFFTAFAFHKQKLIFHRASMRSFADHLTKSGYSVTYVPYTDDYAAFLKKEHISTIHYTTPDDYELARELLAQPFTSSMYDSPGFVSTYSEYNALLGDKDTYHFTSFYRKQRLATGILLDQRGKPVGGSLTYDTKNRLKLPADIHIPHIKTIDANKYTREAHAYVEKHFDSNPGRTESFIYPVTHTDAEAWLTDFLKHRLAQFGPYQDALDTKNHFVFHSLLSPLINVGLLTPSQVVDATLSYAQEHAIPLQSLEGFIRQVIGWREFVRAVYIVKGEKQRASNTFGHTHAMPRAFWSATTALDPVDTAIRAVQEYAYAHHIERLMVLGNIMLLCEIDPTAVYSWFMELFIDAYDWVMVPNVYGMSQYADNGLMTTKPYISSSNYILSMSNFKKGPWCAPWDALFWHFIVKHHDLISQNPRLKIMTFYLKNKQPAVIKEQYRMAEAFLKQLHGT